jgi:hypothetical protein
MPTDEQVQGGDGASITLSDCSGGVATSECECPHPSVRAQCAGIQRESALKWFQEVSRCNKNSRSSSVLPSGFYFCTKSTSIRSVTCAKVAGPTFLRYCDHCAYAWHGERRTKSGVVCDRRGKSMPRCRGGKGPVARKVSAWLKNARMGKAPRREYIAAKLSERRQGVRSSVRLVRGQVDKLSSRVGATSSSVRKCVESVLRAHETGRADSAALQLMSVNINNQSRTGSMVHGARYGFRQGAQTLHGVADIFATKQAAFLSKVLNLNLQLRMPSRWSIKRSQKRDGVSSGHFVGVQPVTEIWKSKDVAVNNRLHVCNDEVSLSQDIDTVDTAQGWLVVGYSASGRSAPCPVKSS